MASAAEQLASNINFGAIGKAEELKKRIWFTLGALVVFRLGTYIPLPGIDTEALLPDLDRHHSDRRDDVPDVARLADHQPGHRQRLVPHHLRGHRRAPA